MAFLNLLLAYGKTFLLFLVLDTRSWIDFKPLSEGKRGRMPELALCWKGIAYRLNGLQES